ncbi:hypothetical protein GF386_03270 [Candidatus Pacearchaeota archaeon]|nr:hypothetical protein [Candidatus Pacearchaeota archaeon]MBD3283160.1 hypothetical protein [Candidatus Pacearchaeota archaeon]
MVSEKVLIRKKYRNLKKFSKIIIISLLIFVAFLVIFLIGYLINPTITGNFIASDNGSDNKIVVENPLNEIAIRKRNEKGEVFKEDIFGEALLEFDKKYIDYILLSLGADKLHKSKIGFGNPVIEFSIDGEVWSSEIIKGVPETKKQGSDNMDIEIIISKEEAVNALLSESIEDYMKNSVNSGDTEIKIVSGKTELLSKGYLEMYRDLIENNNNL